MNGRTLCSLVSLNISRQILFNPLTFYIVYDKIIVDKIKEGETMSKSFIDKVSRVNTSLEDIRKHLEVLIQDIEDGRVILEECQVDTGTFRQVIRLSTRVNSNYQIKEAMEAQARGKGR